MRAKCDRCGAEIIFIKTFAGKMMPCDTQMHYYIADPHGKDTLMVGNRVIRCTIDDKSEEFDGRGYVPHWATCQANKPTVAPKKDDSNRQMSIFDYMKR